MDKPEKTPAKSPFMAIPSSWWLAFTGRALFTVCFLAGIVVIFLGMGLGWSFLMTFLWSFGLIAFSMIAYVVFRAFSDVVARLTDIHNLLEARLNPGSGAEEEA